MKSKEWQTDGLIRELEYQRWLHEQGLTPDLPRPKPSNLPHIALVVVLMVADISLLALVLLAWKGLR